MGKKPRGVRKKTGPLVNIGLGFRDLGLGGLNKWVHNGDNSVTVRGIGVILTQSP